MGQYLGPDRFGTLQKNSTTQVQLNLSSVGDILASIGGQQYQSTSALLLNTSGTGIGGLDAGTLGASQVWYVHLVLNGSTPALVASLSKTAPTGFSLFTWTGYVFYTDQSNSLYVNSIVNITDQVIAKVTGSSTSTASPADGLITFTNEQYDSHNALSTTTFTAPFTAKYLVQASLAFNNTAGNVAVGTFPLVRIHKNGSFYAYGVHYPAATATVYVPICTYSDTIPLNAGDTLTVNIHNATGQTVVCDGSTSNFFSITKVPG